MALLIGNKTQVNQTPAANSYTFSHNQNAGVDKFILVSVTMANTVNFTGCTYNGVTMPLIASRNFSGQSQRWACYGLLTSDDGANNVQVSFTGNQWNPISAFAVSFIGSAGAGNFGSNGGSPTPNSKTLTVSNGSVIYATGLSSAPFTGISIDGSARPLEFQHNTNRQVAGALSANPLSAGTIDVTTSTAFSHVTNQRVEILENGGTPPTSQNSNFLQLF